MKNIQQQPLKPNIDKFIIGLTGGIGSGKTAASDWFALQGITVIDADVVAHQIVRKGQPALAKIKKTFGDWVLTGEGELNRPILREYVFSHPDALVQLENITHPLIRQCIKQQLNKAQSEYVVLSVPLLLEAGKAGLAAWCDRVLVIDVPEQLQLKRASARDGQSVDKIKTIMAKQLSREDRLKQADDVVLNDDSLNTLYGKLQLLHQQYLKFANSKS